AHRAAGGPGGRRLRPPLAVTHRIVAAPAGNPGPAPARPSPPSPCAVPVTDRYRRLDGEPSRVFKCRDIPETFPGPGCRHCWKRFRGVDLDAAPTADDP